VTKESSGTPSNFSFPKSVRILKSADFKKVYEKGRRITSPCFAAFLLSVERTSDEGPRLGFTVPRAFGKSVKRNRAKRRIRELLRVRLRTLNPKWDLVINPRRPALDASPEDLEREVEKLLSRCEKP
jgi:ribonuclease P protein component